MTEGNKKTYMWLSVVLVGLIIGTIWAYSVKYNISVTLMGISQAGKDGISSINEIKDDISGDVNIFDQFLEEISTSTIDTTTSTTTL